MPKSTFSRAGRFKGPSAKSPNELINPPDPTSPQDWEDYTGLEPAGRTPGVNRGPVSLKNRTSRPISGPKGSRISPNSLEYKGT